MGGLGLFKGQKITSSYRLIDIGVLIVNGREWGKASMMSSLGETSKTDMSKKMTRLRQWALKEVYRKSKSREMLAFCSVLGCFQIPCKSSG